MTNREVRTYEITCDACGATERYESTGWRRRPAGWSSRRTCGHGMTDYCKDEDVCPACRDGEGDQDAR